MMLFKSHRYDRNDLIHPLSLTLSFSYIDIRIQVTYLWKLPITQNVVSIKINKSVIDNNDY